MFPQTHLFSFKNQGFYPALPCNTFKCKAFAVNNSQLGHFHIITIGRFPHISKIKKVRLFIALIVLTTILSAYFGFIIIDLKYLATYFTGAIIVTLIWVFFDKMIHNKAS
jgi:hypothetical protein